MSIERFVNNFQTTLSSGIDGSTTTIPVVSGTSIANQFRIRIDDEILIVTAGGTGTSWTATRGAESTSAVSHSSGATITVVLTSGSIQQMIADKVRSGTFASLPATSDALEGQLYLAEDSGLDRLRFNGSNWDSYTNGHKVTLPQVGDFTWVNQGVATADNTFGPLRITEAANATLNIRALVQTAPATPWSRTTFLKFRGLNVNFVKAGLLFRQSSDGKLASIHIGTETNPIIGVAKFTNATTFSASYVTPSITGWGARNGVWLKIEDNGTNRICSAGILKNDLFPIHTIGRTDFLTADQFGLFITVENATYGNSALFYDLD